MQTSIKLDRSLVHMFWIGETLPDWARACVQSYLATGHRVYWWLYRSERTSDDAALREMQQQNKLLNIVDAEGILPLQSAKRFYYHGDKNGKWSGWAPFSDWFRYRVLGLFGGWWVDADGVSVRPLSTLLGEADSLDMPVYCTERHPLNNLRTVGAVAVQQHHDNVEAIGYHSVWEIPPHCIQRKFRPWVRKIQNSRREVGLLTNNHFYVPTPGDAMMEQLATDMYEKLRIYAQEVEVGGVDSVRAQGSKALPDGNVGMTLYQRAVRRKLLMMLELEQPSCVKILHWSVFNPVHAYQAVRMHRVLIGEEELWGKWVMSIHIFRKVRDDLKKIGKEIPHKLEPRIRDSRRRIPRKTASSSLGVCNKRLRTNQALATESLPGSCGPSDEELKELDLAMAEGNVFVISSAEMPAPSQNQGDHRLRPSAPVEEKALPITVEQQVSTNSGTAGKHVRWIGRRRRKVIIDSDTD